MKQNRKARGAVQRQRRRGLLRQQEVRAATYEAIKALHVEKPPATTPEKEVLRLMLLSFPDTTGTLRGLVQ